MLDLPLAILTLAAPLLIGCGVRLLVPGGKRGVVLALALAAAIIPARSLLDLVIHRSLDAVEVGWGFAVIYGLVTGMVGLVLAELVLGRKERRAREAEWQAEPPSVDGQPARGEPRRPDA